MNVLNCVFAGISAISAVAIGVAAFFISKAQLKIDKHKKDDFYTISVSKCIMI